MSFLIRHKVTVFGILIALCCAYNAILGMVNANVFSLNQQIVAATEILLLGCIGFMILITGFKQQDAIYLYLIMVFVFSFVITLIATKVIFIDAIRNILIICFCSMAGYRMSFTQLNRTILFISSIVAIVLFIELTSLTTYVSLLEPAQYFVNTRGLENPEFNETGLFANALGFEGRFSYNIFNAPRTSSIFLEQVSLANFCCVLAIYVSVFWQRFTRKTQLFYVLLIACIVLSNESRVASVISIFCILGTTFSHLIVRRTNVLIAPVSFLVALIIQQFTLDTQSDDFVGRIHVGIHGLANIDFADLFGFGVHKIHSLWDSGYGYMISSSTIFGSLSFLFFVMFIHKQISRESILFALLLNLYIFLSLVIGGNSIYSIKSAAILWFVSGYILKIENEKALTSSH